MNTPDKRVEEIVDKVIEVIENGNNVTYGTKDLTTFRNWLRTTLTQHHQDLMREVKEVGDYIEEHWTDFYDSSKPLSDFRKEILRRLETFYLH